MHLVEIASGIVSKHLPRRQVQLLREWHHNFRRKLYPLIKIIYGTFSTEDLHRHLNERIGKDFEILMVHSSINHMQPCYQGDPMALLKLLVDFVGPERTLAMPAFFFGDPGVNDVIQFYEEKPFFNVRRVPSQMGILTEIFRRWPGVHLSLHPTHRIVALGPLAQALTEGHMEAGSTFGENTPFDFMAKHDTTIIGIGKPYEVLTQVHHPEDILNDMFPVPNDIVPIKITLTDIRSIDHEFVLRWRKFHWLRNMWKLSDFMNRRRLEDWKFHGIPMFRTQAAWVTEDLIKAARQGLTLYENSRTR